jgi:hypothetical protein
MEKTEGKIDTKTAASEGYHEQRLKENKSEECSDALAEALCKLIVADDTNQYNQ